MAKIKTNANGNVIGATSANGRVKALAVPQTPLVGSYELVDAASGRGIWRGEYLGADGVVTGERVADDLWSEACELMRDVNQVIASKVETSRRNADLAGMII